MGTNQSFFPGLPGGRRTARVPIIIFLIIKNKKPSPPFSFLSSSSFFFVNYILDISYLAKVDEVCKCIFTHFIALTLCEACMATRILDAHRGARRLKVLQIARKCLRAGSGVSLKC